MALDLTILHDGVIAMINAPVANPQVACDAMAATYRTYTAVAMAGAASPIFTGLEPQLFSKNLMTAFGINPLPNSPAATATAFATAVNAWWLLPPVVFGGGVVTAFGGAAILLATLTTLMAASNDAETIATAFATAMDIATKTVIVTIGTSTFNLS